MSSNHLPRLLLWGCFLPNVTYGLFPRNMIDILWGFWELFHLACQFTKSSVKKKIWFWKKKKKKRDFLWPLTFCLQLNKNQPVTVHDVLQILRRHVSVPQCDVFGYLTIDHELVVLFSPVDQRPTPMQVTHTQGQTHWTLKCTWIFSQFCRECVCFVVW